MIQNQKNIRSFIKNFPWIKFPDKWAIKLIPPFHGATFRFYVKLPNGVIKSVSFDQDGFLGDDVDYWEVYQVYPEHDNCHAYRCDKDDIDTLLKIIEGEGNGTKMIDIHELNQILENHKIWVESDGELGACADLAYANLAGADLEGANLTKANLKKADLEDANLTGANLKGTCFYRANLAWSEFQGADLEGADLRQAYLRGTNLKKASLKKANLEKANLEKADLENANLTGANVKGTCFDGTNFAGAKLEGAIGLPEGINK